jgi:ammonia channel protein AmtB
MLKQLIIQLYGVGVTVVYDAIVSLILLKLVDVVIGREPFDSEHLLGGGMGTGALVAVQHYASQPVPRRNA